MTIIHEQLKPDMNVLRKLAPIVLLLALFVTSCQKEDVAITTVETEEVEPKEEIVNGLLTRSTSMADGLELGCVTIEYPFMMVLLDSTTIELFSEDDFIDAVSDEDNFPIDFVYPLNVTDADGNASLVNNADELAELFVDCIPDVGWGDEFPDWFFPAWIISYEYSCYQLVYPVTLLDIDSNDVVILDEEELIETLSDGDLYSFAFPLSLENEDGEIVIANDAEDLFDLLAECNPGYGGGCGIGTFGCYELVYPATLELLDGSTVVVEDDDEFAEVLMAGEWAGFVYPLTLIDEEGEEVTVNSDEELDALLLACFDGFDDFDFSMIGCYDIAFPLTVELFDGETVVIEDDDAYTELIFSGEIFTYAFPLSLIDEDGNEITVNSEDELNELLAECFTGGGIDIEVDFICYDIEYPIEVLDLFGGTITINNEEEWANILLNPTGGFAGFVYPITLINAETGEVVEVNSEEELIEAVEECF